MNDLTYRGVMQDLVRNPKDSINKLEAILVNRSTKLNDIKANIVQHEKSIEPKAPATLSGDDDEIAPFESKGAGSAATNSGAAYALNPIIPIAIGGLAMASAYYLFFKK